MGSVVPVIIQVADVLLTTVVAAIAIVWDERPNLRDGSLTRKGRCLIGAAACSLFVGTSHVAFQAYSQRLDASEATGRYDQTMGSLKNQISLLEQQAVRLSSESMQDEVVVDLDVFFVYAESVGSETAREGVGGRVSFSRSGRVIVDLSFNSNEDMVSRDQIGSGMVPPMASLVNADGSVKRDSRGDPVIATIVPGSERLFWNRRKGLVFGRISVFDETLPLQLGESVKNAVYYDVPVVSPGRLCVRLSMSPLSWKTATGRSVRRSSTAQEEEPFPFRLIRDLERVNLDADFDSDGVRPDEVLVIVNRRYRAALPLNEQNRVLTSASGFEMSNIGRRLSLMAVEDSRVLGDSGTLYIEESI